LRCKSWALVHPDFKSGRTRDSLKALKISELTFAWIIIIELKSVQGIFVRYWQSWN